jgi:starch-binding outer membrane protein, SusD/RagB family
MKKNFSIVLLIAFGAVLMSSCSNYLDSDKYFQGRTTLETVFTSKTMSEEWLAHAYSFLPNQNADVCSKAVGTSLHCFADDMYFGDRDVKYDPSDAGQLTYNNFHLGNYTEDDYNGAWGMCYKGIYQASIFIHNIDMNTAMTAKERIDCKGQARFVRAYYYWLLLRKYGPVPLMPDEGVDYNESYDAIATPRSSYDSVADYISSEMVQAAHEIQYTKRGPNDICRPTKGAALAARAYALIFAASPLANGNNDDFAKAFVDDKGNRLLPPVYNEEKWAKAAAACKDVMGLGVYDLYHASFTTSDNGPQDPPTITPPYNADFSNNDWPNGWKNIDPFKSYRNLFDGAVSAVDDPELIFTRGNQPTTSGDGIEALVLHQMPRDFGGWNTHGMTQKMCDAYYMNDGNDCPGKDKEIGRGDGSERVTGFTTQSDVDAGLYKPLGANVSLQYANREPRFYASVAYSGAVWNYLYNSDSSERNIQTFYYRGGGDGYMNSPFHLRTGIGIKKYVHPSDIPNNRLAKPEPAIRYADILLLYAEALNEINNTYTINSWDSTSVYTISRDISEIKKGVCPVRIRAGLPDYSATTYASQNLLRKALKRERYIELMGEGKRYYDLRRWKDAEVEESLPIYGCNVLMDEANRDNFYVPVKESDLQSTFTSKMYFWPISHSELQYNKRLTQEPGWTSY